jgi:hypothetical protein
VTCSFLHSLRELHNTGLHKTVTLSAGAPIRAHSTVLPRGDNRLGPPKLVQDQTFKQPITQTMMISSPRFPSVLLMTPRHPALDKICLGPSTMLLARFHRRTPGGRRKYQHPLRIVTGTPREVPTPKHSEAVGPHLTVGRRSIHFTMKAKHPVDTETEEPALSLPTLRVGPVQNPNRATEVPTSDIPRHLHLGKGSLPMHDLLSIRKGQRVAVRDRPDPRKERTRKALRASTLRPDRSPKYG